MKRTFRQTSILSEIGAEHENVHYSLGTGLMGGGLKPRNDESAGKIKSRKITQWQQIHQEDHDRMRMGGKPVHRTVSIHNSAIYRLWSGEKNAMKVKVAVARKMLVAVWHVLNEGVPIP
ncbi:hypothetical protein [Bacteroides finegoldii]|uniref:hypothetical protein n=1 Tax=Bacteroides finegoldii TaxID=338188 RepID=UPI001FCB1277|nr:hypothetical protein [Bacteroides finegoldii]